MTDYSLTSELCATGHTSVAFGQPIIVVLTVKLNIAS